MAEDRLATIHALVAEHYEEVLRPRPFVAGRSPVPISGRVFDASDVISLVDTALEFTLTAGPVAQRFESAFADFLGRRFAALCNSGSSANLLAVSALTSPRLGERSLRPGDEVITPAVAFPTTVNPIVQAGLVPVFVDVSLDGGYNADPARLEEAIGPRTRAIMMAHTLGNPFDLDHVVALAGAHDLWLVEDNCDAVGSTFGGRLTGTFGELATVSFYPAHHITMGEGGCVLTDRADLSRVVASFRDWGRDCWCDPGEDNTCGKRFGWQLGDLPFGYDHKYTYSHVGYNAKATDLQAAIGVTQLEKLPAFIAARKRNWARLRDGLADLERHFTLPVATPGSDPAWFGFALTVRPEAPFDRRELITWLEDQHIATRQIFAGNLIRQPAFASVRYRVVGDLTVADLVTERSFWIGCYPGITDEMVDYVVERFHAFVDART